MYCLSKKSPDIAGMASKKYFDNYLKTQKLSMDDKVIGPLEKYRRVVKSIINVFRIFKPRKKVSEDHKENPAFLLYTVTLLLWAYLSYLFYFKLVFKSHFDLTITDFAQIFSCFYSHNLACHNKTAFVNLKILYGCCLLWILALLAQMKAGIQVWASSITDFDTMSSIKFGIYGGLPFVREISVVLDFAANNTSLAFGHWFVMEDIKNTMTKAKFRMKSLEKELFGVAVSAVVKWVLRIGILILTLLVVVGPMLPFSDFFSGNDDYPITSTHINIDILTNSGENLTPFFDSNMILRTENHP